MSFFGGRRRRRQSQQQSPLSSLFVSSLLREGDLYLPFGRDLFEQVVNDYTTSFVKLMLEREEADKKAREIANEINIVRLMLNNYRRTINEIAHEYELLMKILSLSNEIEKTIRILLLFKPLLEKYSNSIDMEYIRHE